MKLRTPFLLVAMLLLIACIDDVDFDQVDDIEINTPHKVSLIYFDLDGNDFLDGTGNESLSIIDITEFPFFNSSANEEYLIRTDFEFEAANSFDRAIEIRLGFLNESGNLLFELSPLLINSGEQNFSQTEVLLADDISALVDANFIVINIILDNGINPIEPDFSFNFKSGLTLYYQYTFEDE